MNQLNENISKAEIRKLPFIDHIPCDGKKVFLQPMYSEKERRFKLYIPYEKGKLVEIKNGEPVESLYWSKDIVDSESDIYIELVHLLVNYFSFPKLSSVLISIVNDILNLGTIIYKQLILFDCLKDNSRPKVLAGRIYKTEIEYFMGLIRSFYGLKYEVLRYLFYKCRLLELPDSLGKIADMIYRGNEIEKKYKLNQSIINYWNQILPLFRVCRTMRDKIYHRGTEPDMIFITENGPGVSIDREPFSEFKNFVWSDEVSQKNMLENNIASLFYFFNKITKLVTESAELFATTLKETFRPLQPISEEYKVYLRGPEIMYLNSVQNYLNEYWIKLSI